MIRQIKYVNIRTWVTLEVGKVGKLVSLLVAWNSNILALEGGTKEGKSEILPQPRMFKYAPTTNNTR